MNTTFAHLHSITLDRAIPETWTELTEAQLSRYGAALTELVVQQCLAIVEQRAQQNANASVYTELDKRGAAHKQHAYRTVALDIRDYFNK